MVQLGESCEAACRKAADFMNDREVLADLIVDLTAGIHQAVTGLSVPELTWRPDAEGNSIGVTVWHISRGLDVLKVRFLEQQQALAEQWHTQGWAQKTGYDPRGIGTGGLGILTGYTQEEVAAIPELAAEDLLAYLDQVASALRQYLLPLPEGVLAQSIVAMGESLTAYQLIKGILLGCVGHLGEIEALKALHLRAIQPSSERKRGESYSQQKLEAVRRLFEAVVEHDEASLLEAYHPKIVIHDAPSLPYGGDYHGHEGAIQHVRGFYQTWDTFRRRELLEEAQQAHPPIILDTKGEYVVVLTQARVMAPSSERTIDLLEAFVFKVCDDKVIESWMFHQDTVAILEFLKEAQQ
jgi:DinB superfamily/SnoaL-like domain